MLPLKKFPFKNLINLILLIIVIEFVVLSISFFSKNSHFVNLFNFRKSNTNLTVTNQCNEFQDFVAKQQCWQDLLDSTLKRSGIENAFLVFDDLYKTEPQFASGCHGYAHKLGEATYQLVMQGKDFDFPPQTAYCGYGFYHGLTELLLQTKGIKEAANLCDSKKSQITQVLYDACYHGIGHGALSSTAKDSKLWGDVQKMIDFALRLCQEATPDTTQKSRCASGVFMELGNYYNEGKLQLASLRDDPLSICRQQQEFGKMDCYTQMNGVLNLIAKGNLKESAKFVEDIEEDKYAIEAIITLAAPTIDITKKVYIDDLATCRDLQKRLHLPCIKGLALGFMLRGQPGVEYEDTINFCNSAPLSEEEKDACFDLILRHSKETYSPDIINNICRKIDSRYKKSFCIVN